MRRFLLVVLLVVALVAAACGDDDDATVDDTADATDTATTTDDAADGGAADSAADSADGEATDGAATDDAAADDETADDGAAGDGSASASGVTLDDVGRLVPAACNGDNVATPDQGVAEDSVQLAVVSVDLAPVAAIGFSASDRDLPLIFAEFVSELNDAGGICGRTLDVQQVKFDPLTSTGGEACLEATEDRDNLLVVAPSVLDPFCFTDAGVVELGGYDISEADMETANGLYFNRYPSADDQYRATTQYALDSGALGGKVGVWYGGINPGTGDTVETVVLPMLDDAGIDYLAFRTDSRGPQEPEGQALLGTAATEFAGAEVDTVLAFVQNTNLVGMQGELNAQGIDADYISMPISNNSANEIFNRTYGVQDIADGMRYVTFSIGPSDFDESDPIAASCHEQWTAITGETVEQNTYDYSLITAMCTYVDEVAAALSIAGGDLNRDTLVAAFESLPPHRVPAVVGEVDWGSGERFGPNSFSVLTYDGASNTVAYDAEGVFEVG